MNQFDGKYFELPKVFRNSIRISSSKYYLGIIFIYILISWIELLLLRVIFLVLINPTLYLNSTHFILNLLLLQCGINSSIINRKKNSQHF